MRCAIALGVITLVMATNAAAEPLTDDKLFDWSPWEQYRGAVAHPAAQLKPDDLRRARENIERYEWASKYADGVVRNAEAALAKLTPEHLEQMIPRTTPGDTLFTPCPACRDQGKPAHPHGQWAWSPERPDELKCKICETVFPHEQYAESIVLEAKWGGGQTLTFCGGEPFRIFGYATSRPSFTANIRACKVAHMSGYLTTCRRAYAFAERPEFAELTRRLLLRFAEVYPGWLVHVGYGEYADMDPHVAAREINSLPEDELVCPPNKPDRKLWTGFWSAGRARGVGMEAGFVRQVTEAYDLTCEAKDADGKPIYSEEERRKIERDLLLESTVLLCADPSINNKSVGNRTAVALVGMCLGHPELVRFGLEGFMRTVDDWFLPDGGTSESWSYAGMTLSGIIDAGQAFRGYSDAPGYQDADGQRIENLDLYHDTAYGLAWEAMFNGLQGDLRYPPLADGHRTSGIGARFAEIMAANYPERPHYLALLKEIAGPDLSKGYASTAIFSRQPGLEERAAPPLTLSDNVFPELRLGQFRSGEHGRDSMLVLSATHWGGHHHLDSLNLYYWRDGQELLTDLGYLWDHPHSRMTRRTAAHNLVVIDEHDQTTRGRGGEFHLFHTSPQVKVMEASSTAYGEDKLYRRTVAQVQDDGGQYVADVFRVHGGHRHDWIMHGPAADCGIEGLELAPRGDDATDVRAAIRFHISEVGAEVFVDDVAIVPEGGEDLAENGSAEQIGEDDKPEGWDLYVGDGKCEWGVSSPGRTDERCVFIRGLEKGQQNPLNVALIQGRSNGYAGEEAYVLKPGITYRISFWARGTAQRVNPSFVVWKHNPADANDRSYASIEGVGRFAATEKWTKYEGTLRLPLMYDLQNIRQKEPGHPECLIWRKMPDERCFAISVPRCLEETMFIGDGWGQRDYRNSDVGATLPYIVRRRENGEYPNAFVTVYELARYEPPAPRLPVVYDVPDDAQGNTVAFQVQGQGPGGSDYIISSLEARPVSIELPGGKTIQFDGRFGLLSLKQGKVTRTFIAEGSKLTYGEQEVEPVRLKDGRH